MHKETIKYTDFDGVEITEDFYFNLTEAEVLEKELGITGGYTERLKKIVAAKDAPTIIAEFKSLILDSYGVKEGKRFRKSKELAEEFSQTNAYSTLFMKLAFDDEAGAKFVNGIMPKKSNNTATNAPTHPAINN